MQTPITVYQTLQSSAHLWGDFGFVVTRVLYSIHKPWHEDFYFGELVQYSDTLLICFVRNLCDLQ